nr:hypothetical protein [uncultured Draconibacterium sp.]
MKNLEILNNQKTINRIQMKTLNKIIISLVFLLTLKAGIVNAQDINWNDVENGKKHFVTLSLGEDNSSYYGLTYGYNIGNTKLPLILDAEFSVPFGEDVFDDWNSRIGLQTKLWSHSDLWWSAKASVVTWKFESEVANLLNFGSSLSTLFGYQKSKWGIAAEFTYDRSEITKIKNGITKDYYPEITDGWYNTSGGNFKIGLQANASIKSTNLFLRFGKTYGQDFEHNPTVPFYAKVGISKSF